MPESLPGPAAHQSPPLFLFQGVSRSFVQSRGLLAESTTIQAVRDVTLAVHKGETLGLVGESGCGKSTLARMAVRLLRPSSGDILLDGHSLFTSASELAATFHRRLQMVFQDPYSSLNPRMTVGSSVGEALACAGASRTEQKEQVTAILDEVGLMPEHAGRYPHEFSGGQRQRLAIARALITKPDFVVCDEPVSSLDASVQAQVLGLLKDMQDRLGLTYLFISHDLAVISHMSDRVAVMYRGLIVELSAASDFFAGPLHPYAQALLAAVPAALDGEPEAAGLYSPQRPYSAATDDGAPKTTGCPYSPFCPHTMPVCPHSLPGLASPDGSKTSRLVRCHLWAQKE